ENCRGRGTAILCDVKLRAPSRQFDGQAPQHLQATDPQPEAGPLQGRLLRADGQRRPALFQAQDGRLPQREMGRRSRRRTAEEERRSWIGDRRSWIVKSRSLRTTIYYPRSTDSSTIHEP